MYPNYNVSKAGIDFPGRRVKNMVIALVRVFDAEFGHAESFGICGAYHNSSPSKQQDRLLFEQNSILCFS